MFRFCTKATAAVPPTDLPSFPKYMGAGCVFTDGTHILAGYQPHKAKPGINGLGGHKESGETYLQTAFRETVEELFHVETSAIPSKLLPTLIQTLVPTRVKLKNDYVLVHFTLDQLLVFLRLVKASGLTSPLFPTLPLTLLDLLQKRRHDPKAEVAVLCLLPVIKHPLSKKGKEFVTPYFVKDLWEL